MGKILQEVFLVFLSYPFMIIKHSSGTDGVHPPLLLSTHISSLSPALLPPRSSFLVLDRDYRSKKPVLNSICFFLPRGKLSDSQD